MKKMNLLLIVLLAFTGITNAQCLREGSLTAVDDPANYPVAGTAIQSFEVDGVKEVIFGEDFATVQGIELRVFLTTTERLGQGGEELEITTEPLQDDNGGTDMGDPITGMKVFELPADVELNDFNYVIIQCVSADVLWGRASLGTPAGADCDILSVNDAVFDNLVILPNAFTGQLSIQGMNEEITGIRIFDTTGKQVLNKNSNINNTMDISTLSTGIYLVSLSAENAITTKKIIVQ